jgi:hypothetical protein
LIKKLNELNKSINSCKKEATAEIKNKKKINSSAASEVPTSFKKIANLYLHFLKRKLFLNVSFKRIFFFKLSNQTK